MIYYLEYDRVIEHYFKQDIEKYQKIVNELKEYKNTRDILKYCIDNIDISDPFEYYVLLLTCYIRYYLTIIDDETYYKLTFDELMEELCELL